MNIFKNENQFTEWTHNYLTKQNIIHFHIPNERIDGIERAKLKRMGVLNGVADFEIWLGNVTLYIELKQPKGVQSPSQKQFQQTCLDNNRKYFIIRTPTELKNLLSQYLST